MRPLLVLLATASVASAHPVRGKEPYEREVPQLWMKERLPRAFVPSGYQLRIEVGKQLRGHVTIEGTMAARTPAIWLDFVGEITDARVWVAAGSFEVAVKPYKDRIGLYAEKWFGEGAIRIDLDFTASIDDQGTVKLPADGGTRDPIPEEMSAATKGAAGAFRQTVDGLAYTFTQSEPMDTRKIFPCVDEPDRKVPWQLTLDVPADQLAASNAPLVKETTLPNGLHRFEFAPTRPLPSYLLAFAVGPFDVIPAGKTHSGAPIRILETRGHTAAYAAQTAGKVLDLVEAWTGVPYAYPKLDLVAIPRTGLWAAMENPGLVTFADWAIRPDARSENRRMWVFIAAHEFAHQWFGDLVTMAWWNDIWLNESFAVWVGRIVLGRFDPAWAEPANDAYLDRVETARPPDGSRRYEDYFAGGRGARSIAELERLLGPAKFREAIHAYLVAHADGNATTAELAAEVSKVYGSDLGPTLVAMLDGPRPPVVTVTPSCTEIAITSVPPAPVCIAYEAAGKRVDRCVIGDATLPVTSCPRWVIPNAGAAMHYGVRRRLGDLFRTAADWALLEPAERLALLAELGPDVPLALKLADAPDARAWAAETFVHRAVLAPDRARLEAWLAKRYVARARQLHFAPVTREDEAVIAAASETGDPVLTKEAVALVRAGVHDLATNVLGAVARLAMRADAANEVPILAELDRAFFERRRQLLDALGERPGVYARADSIPQLTASDRVVLLAATCDPVKRVEAQRVASQLSDGVMPLLGAFNDCLDEREHAIAAFRSLTQ